MKLKNLTDAINGLAFVQFVIARVSLFANIHFYQSHAKREQKFVRWSAITKSICSQAQTLHLLTY